MTNPRFSLILTACFVLILSIHQCDSTGGKSSQEDETSLLHEVFGDDEAEDATVVKPKSALDYEPTLEYDPSLDLDKNADHGQASLNVPLIWWSQS